MILSSGILAGRYEIVAPLGRGATSEVYRAHDTVLHRDVALKLISKTSEEGAQRIEREVRAASALNHPNVLSILDRGALGGRPFLVYELLEGRTLRDLLSAGPLPLSQALDYAAQTARGLLAAHEKSIVHRDLKPENLFITSDGRVKILDFGLVQLLRSPPERASDGSEDSDTIPGVLLGTVGYMAPEQVRTKPATAAADVFAFGAILYEMLSGRRAFTAGSEVETLNAILTTEPPDPEGTAEAPSRLLALMRNCLRKDPGARPPIARCLAEIESIAAPQASPGPLRSLPRTAALGAMALGVAIAAIGISRQTIRQTGPPHRSGANRNLAVLPFQSLGGEIGDAAFAAGLSEILTMKLSQIEQGQGSLQVVSSRDVKSEGISSAREARRVFGSTLALAGNVQRRGGDVLVSVNLLDAERQIVIAEREVRVSRSQMAHLQDLLVQKVAEMLELQLDPKARLALSRGLTAVPSAYDFYLHGVGYLRRYDRLENLDSAIAVFRRALEQDPRYALAQAGIAEAQLRRYRALRDLRMLEEARRNGEKALALDEGLAAVQYTVGLIEMSSGAHEQATFRFLRALDLSPGDGEAIRELANAYDAAGRTEEAEQAYRRACELNQNPWAAYNDLGAFYFRHGKLAEAVDCFRRVTALTPDSYAGYSSLGGVLLRQGRYAEAIEAFRTSLSLKPTAKAYSNLAVAHYDQGRYSEAADMFRKAIELNPNSDIYWGNLGDASRSAGRKAEAAKAYRRAQALAEAGLRADASDAPLWARSATYLSFLGEQERALAEAEKARNLRPGDPQILFRLAVVCELGHRRACALDSIRRALEAGLSIEELRSSPHLSGLLSDPGFSGLSTKKE